MKKLFILIIGFFLISAFTCSGPVQDPICDQVEGYSFICDKSREQGIEPETVYGWIFAPAAVASVADEDSRKFLCEFSKDVGDWYVDHYPISYTGVITEVLKRSDLIEDEKQAQILLNALSSNLYIYQSPQIISKKDDYILRAGNNRFQLELLCE